MEDTTHSQGGDERKCGRQYQTCPKVLCLMLLELTFHNLNFLSVP
jgi:hypothetical protein